MTGVSRGKRGRAHRFIPFLLMDRTNRDAEIPELCNIRMNLLYFETDPFSAHDLIPDSVSVMY